MTRIYNYQKTVNGPLLHEQLTAAGFAVTAVMFRPGKPYCQVIVEDGEARDPSGIVADHDPMQLSRDETETAARTARVAVAMTILRTIKARGKDNWTQADLRDALAAWINYVGI